MMQAYYDLKTMSEFRNYPRACRAAGPVATPMIQRRRSADHFTGKRRAQLSFWH
jgi:hypothetical protein